MATYTTNWIGTTAYSKWYNQNLFSDIVLVDSVSKNKFHAHRICLAENSYFKSIMTSAANGATTFKTIDNKLEIEVKNLKMALVYIKIIYTNTYSTDDIPNFTSTEDFIDWLEYCNMWFMGSSVLTINFRYVYHNIRKLLQTHGIGVIPVIDSNFSSQGIVQLPNPLGRPFEYTVKSLKDALLTYLSDNPNNYTMEVLEWDFAKNFNISIITNILKNISDISTLARFVGKFSGQLGMTSVINYVYRYEKL